MKIFMECFSNLFNKYYYNYRLLARDATVEELTFLLKDRKVNPNFNINGFNALHAAASSPIEHDGYKRIDILLAWKVNVNNRDYKGDFNNTPLHLLIANENTQLAKYYLDKARELEININFAIRDRNGATPLILASKLRLQELALYIIHHISLKQGTTLDMQDDDGMTALHYASVLGQLELVKQLLAKGARKTQNINMEFPEDLTEYKESDVRKILESVKVDPDRDEKALLNLFHDKNGQIIMVKEKIIGTVVIMLTRKTTDIVVRPCFISSKKKNEKFLNDVLDNKDLIDSTKLILNKTRVAMSDIDKEFIRNQCKVLTGTSLISACMNGQVEVRNYWISEQDISHDGRNKNEEKYKISSSHYSFHIKKIEDQKNINYNSTFTSR